MSIREEIEHILKPEAPIIPKPSAPFKRTLGSIQIALEAQKIYNPSLPSVPKSPGQPTPEQGTAAKMGTEGRWGTDKE